MNSALIMDYYALTMAYSYFQQQRAEQIAYFDYFFREIPDKGGYAIFAGLEPLLEHLQNFKFSAEELDFLRQKSAFSPQFIDYLADFRFRGDLWSVPEGSVIFPQEPVVSIKAPLIDCILVESFLLSTLNHQSRIATKSARIVQAAQGKQVLEMGARRAHGVAAAVYGARAAYIGGVNASSNVYSDFLWQIPSVGTMAHAYVQSFSTEYEAFYNYAQTYPDNCWLLIDTYDVLKQGIENAIKLQKEYLNPLGKRLQGVRIDSGDLAYLSRKVRERLDEENLHDVKIVATNSLDEYLIQDLRLQQAQIDVFGVGERLITAKSNPVFGGVYKIVALEENGKLIPKIKISATLAKTTTPARKNLWRLYDEQNMAIADVITLWDEEIDSKNSYRLFDPDFPWKEKIITNFKAKKLLKQYLENGNLLQNLPKIEEIRAFSQQELATLWNEVKRLEHPHLYYVDLSQALWQLKHDLIKEQKTEQKCANM